MYVVEYRAEGETIVEEVADYHVHDSGALHVEYPDGRPGSIGPTAWIRVVERLIADSDEALDREADVIEPFKRSDTIEVQP